MVFTRNQKNKHKIINNLTSSYPTKIYRIAYLNRAKMSNSLHVHLVKQLVTLLLGRMSRLVKREEKNHACQMSSIQQYRILYVLFKFLLKFNHSSLFLEDIVQGKWRHLLLNKFTITYLELIKVAQVFFVVLIRLFQNQISLI